MNSAQAVLCCIQEDDFSIQTVFNTLFKVFKANSDKYQNLLSTVIYFIDKDDYKNIVDEKPKVFEPKKDQLDQVFEDLKDWGGLDQDLML